MDITRTRTGCWTCRSRRIKCDEARPVCMRCSASGKNLKCGYDIRLTWQEDHEARGVSHGRTGVWSKAGRSPTAPKQALNSNQTFGVPRFPTIENARFLNTTFNDVEMHMGHGEADQADQAEVADTTLLHGWDMMEYEDLSPDPGSPERALSLFAHTGQTSQYDHILIRHYEKTICSSSTLLDDERYNPYRHVLLPMAMDPHAPGIYHATLAISANVLRLANSEYAIVALDHRQKALRRLISLLEHGRADTSREMDEMLGLVLMLCWFEISDGCSPSWVKHLSGFRKIIERHQQITSRQSPHSQNVGQFFMRYFAFHLVLAKTTFQPDGNDSDDIRTASSIVPSPSEDPTPATREPSQDADILALSPSSSFLAAHMNEDSMDEIDLYKGFSDRLLLLINEITDLVPLGKTTDNKTIFIAKARHLKSSLDTVQQHLPEFPVSSSTSSSTSTPPPTSTPGPDLATRKIAISATAETYRQGAVILLHHILTQCHTAGSSTVASHVIIVPAKEQQTAIASILNTIDHHFETMIHTAALPLWSLFLAGCCVDNNEELRMTALRIFETIEAKKRFGNVAPARMVMEMVWRQRDLGRDQRRTSVAAAAATNRKKILPDPAAARPQGLYEWERAAMLLGGWKISLT